MTDENNVQRWTGLVEANEAGGFVAVGDYIAIRAENERLKAEASMQSNNGAELLALREQVKQISEPWKPLKNPFKQKPFLAKQELNLYEANDQLRAQLEQAQADAARYRKTLKWLDKWIGAKPLYECTNKVRQALKHK